jgi:hypothetical protein
VQQLCQVESRDIVSAHTALPQGHTKTISSSDRPTSQRFLEYYDVARRIVKTRSEERVMWQAEETEMYTWFLWEKRKERDNLEDLGVDVRVILKPVLKEYLWMLRTGSISYRIWAHSRLFSKIVNNHQIPKHFVGNYWASGRIIFFASRSMLHGSTNLAQSVQWLGYGLNYWRIQWQIRTRAEILFPPLCPVCVLTRQGGICPQGWNSWLVVLTINHLTPNDL